MGLSKKQACFIPDKLDRWDCPICKDSIEVPEDGPWYSKQRQQRNHIIRKHLKIHGTSQLQLTARSAKFLSSESGKACREASHDAQHLRSTRVVEKWNSLKLPGTCVIERAAQGQVFPGPLKPKFRTHRCKTCGKTSMGIKTFAKMVCGVHTGVSLGSTSLLPFLKLPSADRKARLAAVVDTLKHVKGLTTLDRRGKRTAGMADLR